MNLFSVLLSDLTFSLRQHGHWPTLHQAPRSRHEQLSKLDQWHHLYDSCHLSTLMLLSRLSGLWAILLVCMQGSCKMMSVLKSRAGNLTIILW